MVTLKMASRSPQSPQSPPSPHIPEQSWQEPPPPFLQLRIFTQNHYSRENNGPSTLMYVTTYSLYANNNDATVKMTMDDATLYPHSSTASALLLITTDTRSCDHHVDITSDALWQPMTSHIGQDTPPNAIHVPCSPTMTNMCHTVSVGDPVSMLTLTLISGSQQNLSAFLIRNWL